MKCEMELGQKHQKGMHHPFQLLYISTTNIRVSYIRHRYHHDHYKKKDSSMTTRMKLSASKALTCLLLVVVVSGLVQESAGHPCGSTFFSALVQLIPCRSAVAPFSPIPPTEACCASIKALGQPCLCVLVNGPPISGVDRSMAMLLPEKCTANFEPCEMM